ncbi:MAG: hypothetical protein V7637_5214 [Mycobacteriales bacterium]|jgi:hypothetical protein
MAVVALYPLGNTTLDAVRNWWQHDLPVVLQNGGGSSAFSPLARSVLIMPLTAGPVIAVQFDSATDASNGNADLQNFWKNHGVGKLNTPAVVVATPYGPDPNAMMVWCPAPH